MATTYSTKLTNMTLPNNYSITGNGSYINFQSSIPKSALTVPHGGEKIVIDELTTLEIKGKVEINGFDLEERLNIIEKVLMIPQRDAIMEFKYPSLKQKFDEYISALEKYKTFERIKGE